MASAVFNAAREMAGLLGITVIGVVLTTRQSAEVHLGRSSVTAFLSGYRLGLVVAGALVAAGGLLAWVALRRVSPLGNTVPLENTVPLGDAALLPDVSLR